MRTEGKPELTFKRENQGCDGDEAAKLVGH